MVLYLAPPAGGSVGLSVDVQTVSRDIGAPVEEEPLEPEESPPIVSEQKKCPFCLARTLSIAISCLFILSVFDFLLSS